MADSLRQLRVFQGEVLILKLCLLQLFSQLRTLKSEIPYIILDNQLVSLICDEALINLLSPLLHQPVHRTLSLDGLL